MDDNSFAAEVNRILSGVKHPYISRTLKELGILKSVQIDSKKVIVALAYPFGGIPIKNEIERIIRKPLEDIGAFVEITATVMNQQELQKFLAMEQDAWAG
ncbi:MAG: DUF59 domain-containing protein [Elusimicrobia bacterium]|nr:DUF59 domain-containing protein [Elusimicrobiota bacterium]